MLVDSNVWIAWSINAHAFHAKVREWTDSLRSNDSIVFCRSTQQSFLRQVTTAALFATYDLPPLTNREAWTAYERFFTDKIVSFATEPKGLDAHWKKFCSGTRPSPKLWMDAYLAAFAIAGGYRFVTTDTGFKQFKGLDLELIEA